MRRHGTRHDDRGRLPRVATTPPTEQSRSADEDGTIVASSGWSRRVHSLIRVRRSTDQKHSHRSVSQLCAAIKSVLPCGCLLMPTSFLVSNHVLFVVR